MSKPLNSQQLGELFSYPFQDPKWFEKFLIGSVLLLFSFLIFPLLFLYGYFAKLVQDVVESGELSLPEWDDWEKKFLDGARLFAIGFVYVTPILLFIFFLFFSFLVGSVAGIESTQNSDSFAPVWSVGPMFGTFIYMGTLMIVAFFYLILSVFTPAMICHVIIQEEFSAAFQIRGWWDIFRANPSGFISAYILVLGLTMILSFAYQFLGSTLIFCFLIPFIFFPGTFFVMTTSGAIFGQAYRDAQQTLNSKRQEMKELQNL